MRSIFLGGLILFLVGSSPVSALGEKEDVLSARNDSVVDLIADGYQVVDYEMGRRENTMILRKRFQMALCIIEDPDGDDESLELASLCYRLR